MKHYTPSPISPEVIRSLRHKIATGATQTEVILEMRHLGLHQVESIKLIRLLYGTSLGEAKAIIHFSETWADRRESNEAFHENAIAAAMESGFEDVSHVKHEQSNPILR